jgi:hypothetical protein
MKYNEYYDCAGNLVVIDRGNNYPRYTGEVVIHVIAGSSYFKGYMEQVNLRKIKREELPLYSGCKYKSEEFLKIFQ